MSVDGADSALFVQLVESSCMNWTWVVSSFMDDARSSHALYAGFTARPLLRLQTVTSKVAVTLECVLESRLPILTLSRKWRHGQRLSPSMRISRVGSLVVAPSRETRILCLRLLVGCARRWAGSQEMMMREAASPKSASVGEGRRSDLHAGADVVAEGRFGEGNSESAFGDVVARRATSPPEMMAMMHFCRAASVVESSGWRRTPDRTEDLLRVFG